MNRTALALALAATAALVSPAVAQVDENAKAAMKESAAAILKLESFSGKVRRSATGALKDIIDADGNVKYWRPAGGKAAYTMVVGRLKNPGQGDKKVHVSYDGTNVRWLDAAKNTLFERPMADSQASEEVGSSKIISVPEMTGADNFDSFLQFPKVTIEGQEKVNGEICDKVVAYPSPDRFITWYISVADRLPRRLEQGTGEGENRIALITDISDLKVGEKFTAKDFELALPVGYAKDSQMPPPAPEFGVKGGNPAPDFKAVDSTGKEHTPASLKGNVVVLQFFGSMFKASLAACAEVQAMADEYKGKNVVFVGVACRELSDSAAADYWKNNKFTYTLVPKGDEVAKAFKVAGYPSIAIINADGSMAAFHQDNPGKDKLTLELQAAGVK